MDSFMDALTKVAIHNEHNVYHHLGLRCRECGHINETGPDSYSAPVPLEDGCAGCWIPVPVSPAFTPEQLELVHAAFEPLVWRETLAA